MKRIVLFFLAVIFVAASAFAQQTPEPKKEEGVAKFTFGENKSLELHYLLQAQTYFSSSDQVDAAGEKTKEYWNNTNQVRRSRIILKGQVAKNVTFFVETDDFKIGASSDGQSTSKTFIQDAYMNFKIANELEIAAGMILVPFMHHNRASAVTLLGLDYNSSQVPVGSNVWRDAGIELRGLLLGGKIDYKVGMFNGKDFDTTDGIENDGSRNSKEDRLRVTGRVQVNIFDAETGFFYSENYLGKSKIFSIGFGIDSQNNSYQETATTEIKDYLAWTADLTVDLPVANKAHTVAFRGAYVKVLNSPFANVLDETLYFAQAGFAIMNKIQPVIKYAVQDIKDSKKVTDLGFGVNYFINGHNANIKAEFNNRSTDYDASGAKTVTEKTVTVQGQIFI